MSTVPVQQVTVLGATGSIGTSTLDVIARHPDRYRVYALTAHTSKEALLAQCREHRPRFAVLDDANDAEWLQQALAPTGIDTKVLSGPEALCDVASVPEVDTVMAAIVETLPFATDRGKHNAAATYFSTVRADIVLA